MVYIVGEKETVRMLMTAECFDGSVESYLKQLQKLNPQCKLDLNNQLPPYTPLLLVNTINPSETHSQFILTDVYRMPLDERKILREMQEDRYDFITQITLDEIMNELQEYAQSFRIKLDEPLFQTPWRDFNASLSNSSLIDIFAGTASFTSRYLTTIRPYTQLDPLYESMIQRDALNRELYLLTQVKGKNILVRKRAIEAATQTHTHQIKQLLPKKLDQKTHLNLNKQFTRNELIKMRSNSYSKKMARKNSLTVTNLHFLSRSGLGRLKNMIKFLKSTGSWLGGVSKYIGRAAVAYDTIQAARSKDRSAVRAFLTGSTALGTGVAIGAAFGGTSSFGGLLIGALAGDAALSGTILLFSPVIGWIVCGAVGLVAAGYIANKASEAVGELWDTYGDTIIKETKQVYKSVEEKVISLWSSVSSYFLELYGN